MCKCILSLRLTSICHMPKNMNVVPNWAYLGSWKKRLYRCQFLPNQFHNVFFCFQVRRMTRSLAGQMEGLRRREDSSSSNVPKSLKNREKQITKMMAIIFATFLMTYIPGYLVKQVRFFAQAAIILGQSMIYHFTF